MATDEGIAYLRQKGIHIMLERLARGLISSQPADPVQYMEAELAQSRLFTLPQTRCTAADIQKKQARIRKTFTDVKVTVNHLGKTSAPFSLSHSTPAPAPALLEDVADCLTYVYDFLKADVIVGAAKRLNGAIVHSCAARTGQPYSLSNWYPGGLAGDIKVDAPGSQEGGYYLNSVENGARCIIVSDVLWTGEGSAALARALAAAGATPVAAVFVGEAADMNGRINLKKEFPSMEIVSLVPFVITNGTTQPKELKAPVPAASGRSPLMQYTPPSDSKLEIKTERAIASFVDVPIGQTPAGYPYCKFPVTDYTPCMRADLIEDIADCCVAAGNFSEADIIVTAADRGGGPLAVACAVRTGLPFSTSMLSAVSTDYDSDDSNDANEPSQIAVHLGAMSVIQLLGVNRGMKAIIVADMLSSGSSAETLIGCVERAGGEVVGAVFASEKVNLYGRRRLQSKYPNIKLAVVCKFVAEPSDSSVKFTGNGLRKSERFRELKLGFNLAAKEEVHAPRRHRERPGSSGKAADGSALPKLGQKESHRSSISSTSSLQDTGRDDSGSDSDEYESRLPDLGQGKTGAAKPFSHGLNGNGLAPSVKVESLETKFDRVKESFLDVPVTEFQGKPYASFALNENVPALKPELVEDMIDCLTAAHDFSGAEMLVAAAERSHGPLVHTLARRIDCNISLSNWYPLGLEGDVLVEKKVGTRGTEGTIYLNSVKSGQKVVLIADVLWSGEAQKVLASAVKELGATLQAFVFVGEACCQGGRAALGDAFPGVPVVSLVKYNLSDGVTKLQGDASVPQGQTVGERALRMVRMPADHNKKLEAVEAAFVGVKIGQTPAGYPYCMFRVTDYAPAMYPELVESMAECCVAAGNFQGADVIVSEADRGSGPLTQACAIRTGLPYCLASRGPSAGNAAEHTSEAFGGKGTLQLRGLRAGQDVMVVTDVLSSGGTAEALFHCIIKAGCNIVGAVFVSEKVNMYGRNRLSKRFPDVKINSLVKFVAEPADPTVKFTGDRMTEKFKELTFQLGSVSVDDSLVAAPRRRGKSVKQ